MKKLFAVLSIALCLCLLGGCMGTPVIYHENCDCPTEGGAPANDDKPVPEGALKTGLILITDISGSAAATADKNGEGKYDVTMVAVLVDDGGVIQDCVIDGISTSVQFDTAGKIAADLSAPVKTKNELGKDYGMGAISSIQKEWNEQAQALADFAVGKTVAQLREGAIDETGKAPAGSDLASSATIYLGGYVSAIEAAAAGATHLGAQGGDSLKLAAAAGISGSKDAGEQNGTAQLEVTVTALTMNGDTITSCVIDSVQATVLFDGTGAIVSDLTAPVKTKNELGKDYGMGAISGIQKEWNEQAAAFAAYVTGKTPAQVTGIAVNESTNPTDSDLASSVTIAIGGFQALIQKAAQ